MRISEGMGRSRSAPPRLLHATQTTPQAVLCLRLPLPKFPRRMDSCSSRGSQGISASRYNRAISKLQPLSVTPLIEHADFLEALDDYGIHVTMPPA